MAFPIKWFSSAMAPTLLLSTGSAGAAHTVTPGSLISVLKACLVTGFGIKTVSAINYDAATAKIVLTIPSGHTYQQYQVIEISGANESGFNGQFRVMKVTTTTVECALDNGIPSASAATGSLSAKIPGLGWVVEFEDAATYRCIFKRSDASATDYRMLIDNSAWAGWNSASGHLAKAITIYNVTDINTYTVASEDRIPCSHNYATPNWWLVGSSKFVYFIPKFAAAGQRGVYAWGDFPSRRPGDKHNLLINMHYTKTSDGVSWANAWMGPYNDFCVLGSTLHKSIARSYTQLPTGGVAGVAAKFVADNPGGYMGYGFPIAAIPVNPADNGFVFNSQVKLFDDGSWRGYVPGLRNPYSSPLGYDGKVLVGLNGDMTLCLLVSIQSNGGGNSGVSLIGFDIVGPW